MTTLPKKYEPSFSNLAELLGIQLKTGWKTRLAEWFGVELPILSKWIDRGLPKYRVKELQKKGYPLEKWHIPTAENSDSENMKDESPAFPANQKKKTKNIKDRKNMPHESIIASFKNPEVARILNMKLLEIEEIDENELIWLDGYLEGKLEMMRKDKKNKAK